jgi:hypothetical protein
MAILTDLQIQILCSALAARHRKAKWTPPANIALDWDFQGQMEVLVADGYMQDGGMDYATAQHLYMITPSGFYAVASHLGLIPVCTFE